MGLSGNFLATEVTNTPSSLSVSLSQPASPRPSPPCLATCCEKAHRPKMRALVQTHGGSSSLYIIMVALMSKTEIKLKN